MNLSQRIKTLRRNHRLSLRQLANKASVSVATIFKIEKNITKFPKVECLNKIAKVFDIDTKELLIGVELKQKLNIQRRLTPDHNLQVSNSVLAKEWHPTKNRDLTPKDITPHSSKKVWWLCNKGHEWLMIVDARSRGYKCPYCSGRAVCEDNCLETINPSLSKQWHPNKNLNLTPKEVTVNSNKKVWWLCKNGHEWKARIADRNKGKSCPYCKSKILCKDNSLLQINPKLASEWHPTKNGRLTPGDVFPNTRRIVWWLCKRGHEWKALVNNRSQGNACPFCHSSTSQHELRIYSELKKLFDNVRHRKIIYGKECDIFIPRLKLAIEVDSWYWHKDKYSFDNKKTEFLKNKGITLIHIREPGLQKVSPLDIISPKQEKGFTLMQKVVEAILQHFSINDKIKIKLQLYLKNGVLVNEGGFMDMLYMLPSPLPGYSLYDKNRELANEWHPSKNKTFTAKDVSLHSNIMAWWQCKNGHEWQAKINNRANGRGCPYCSGRRANEENCLQTLYPDLAKEWHPTKNGVLTPRDVTPGSHLSIWWLCKNGHEWKTQIYHRKNGTGCPYCKGVKKIRLNE